MIRHCRRGPGLLVVFALGTAAGCGGAPTPEPVTANDTQMMRLVSLYTQYRAKNGKPPESTDELKKWAKSLKPGELSQLGIEDVDQALVSPRDNQPYQLAKPGNTKAAKMGAQSVIFYEKEGLSGKHMVVGGMGTRPREVTREQLKTMVPEFTG